jgi:tetratricopeptide (TPR) repeat protein
MRRILLAAAMAAFLLLAKSPAHAGGGHHGHHHHGGGWGHHHHRHWGGWGGWGGGIGFSIGYGRPYFSYGYFPAYRYAYPCYSPSYYYPTPIGYYGYYGSTYNPSANFASLYVNRSSTLPANLRNLLDLDRAAIVARLINANDKEKDAGGLQVADVAAAERPVRVANIAMRRKADQQIATGDMLFREQNFHAALQRYKQASQFAPDMAETYWRQGHALIATANYELAGGAFKRALALDPATEREAFTLDKLYGAAAIAKAAHLEGLAAWALAHADSSEPYFLMGVTLHYDAQPARAAKFFARASELAGVGGGHLTAFAPPAAAGALAAEVPAEVPPAPPPIDVARPAVEQPPPPPPALPVSAVVEI